MLFRSQWCPVVPALGTHRSRTETMKKPSEQVGPCIALGLVILSISITSCSTHSASRGVSFDEAMAVDPGLKLDPSRAPGAASPAPAPGAGQSYQLPGTSPGAPEGGHFGIINPSAPPIQQSEQAVAAAMQFQGTRGYQQDVANGVPAPDALVKWAPLMFYADPSGMSAALAMATAPPPEPKVAPVPSSPQPPSRAREAVEDTLTVGTGF